MKSKDRKREPAARIKPDLISLFVFVLTHLLFQILFDVLKIMRGRCHNVCLFYDTFSIYFVPVKKQSSRSLGHRAAGALLNIDVKVLVLKINRFYQLNALLDTVDDFQALSKIVMERIVARDFKADLFRQGLCPVLKLVKFIVQRGKSSLAALFRLQV